jgi:hypothetical protein
MALGNQRFYSEENIPLLQMQGAGGQDLASMYSQAGQAQQIAQERRDQKALESNEKVSQLNAEAKVAPWRGVQEGIDKGLDSYERIQDRRQKNEQLVMQREQAATQKALSEESLAGAKQSREFSEQDRPLDTEIKRTQAEVSKANASVAQSQAKEADSQTAFNDAVSMDPNALPNETNRQFALRSDAKVKGINAETAQQQLALTAQSLKVEEQRLAQAKDMQPLQKQEILANIEARKADLENQKMQIAGLQKEQRIADATNVLLTAFPQGGQPNLEMAKSAIENAKLNGVTNAELASAISRSNASKTQQLIMAQSIDNLDPVKRAQKEVSAQSIVQANQTADVYRQAVTDMNTAVSNYKSAAALNDGNKVQEAIKQYEGAARAAGFDIYADDVQKRFSLGRLAEGTNPFARGDAMERNLKDMQQTMSNKIRAFGRHDQKFVGLANEIEKINPGQEVKDKWKSGLGGGGMTPIPAGAPNQSKVPSGGLTSLDGMPGITINKRTAGK